MPALEKQVDDLEERYDDLPSRDEFNTLRQLVLALQGTVDLLSTRVSELQDALKPQPLSKAAGPSIAPVTDMKSSGSSSIATDVMEKGLVSEFAKKALTFPESSRLKGVANYEQWLQALKLVLKANNLDGYFEKREMFTSLSPQSQAIAMLLIRESLAAHIASSITWIESPVEALNYLEVQYSQRDDARRDSLYREFHALKLSAKGPVEYFNSNFNELLSRLMALGVRISPKDTANQYLHAVERAQPQWVERQRSAIRQAAALGQAPEKLNLPYLQSDLAEESRRKIVPSSHYGTRAGQEAQQGTKKRKKGKRGQKVSYGPAKPAENQSHSFFMSTFHLGPESSDSSTSKSGETDSSDSEGEIDPYSHGNRPKGLTKGSKKPSKPKKHGKAPKRHEGRKIPALLYDTGSTDHIINDRRWFKDFSGDTSGLPTLRTGGGPVTPKNSGTAEFLVLVEQNKGYYTKLTLKNALYLPQVDINIISGEKHYRAGGTLIRDTLYSPNQKPCGALNVAKHGFFLQI